MRNFTTMKTKLFLTAICAIFMMASANAQDNRNTKVPGHPGIVNPTAGYITTADNEDNLLTGSPDGDMDVYLFRGDPGTPIEFNVFIADPVVTAAQLTILAWDIDWDGGGFPPERDQVFVNGTYVGDLTGVNDQWSTSVFNVPTALIIPGPAGKNTIRIDIDVLQVGWAVEVDWGQFLINEQSGTAVFRYVNLDKPTYCGGQCVQITEEVDATPDLNVRVETYLIDPSNNAIAQANQGPFLATSGDEPFIKSLCLPAVPAPGVWKVRTICYNASTNVQEDFEEKSFTVTNPCNPNIPTMTEWGLIFLGMALLGFGTFYIMKMRG